MTLDEATQRLDSALEDWKLLSSLESEMWSLYKQGKATYRDVHEASCDSNDVLGAISLGRRKLKDDEYIAWVEGLARTKYDALNDKINAITFASLWGDE